MRLGPALVILLSTLPMAAYAQAPDLKADFVLQASVGNTFEIEEAKLALKQSTDPKLKAFAKMMIHDHSMAEKKLMAAAQASGVPVSVKMDDPHQAMITALQGKTGTEFDKAYVADQVKAHQEAETLLKGYEATGVAPKLKTWAKATLPTVRMHLKKIQAMS